MAYLTGCPSVAHRAVAGALRHALGQGLTDDTVADCAAADPMEFAEIAQSHYVDTALAPVFAPGGEIAEAMPRDLGLFLTEMRAANGRRNAALRAQLSEIAAAFELAGVTAVALKGAAELLDPWWPDVDGRYLSDLDILVPEDQVAAAMGALEALGAERVEEDADREGHHHLPPCRREDWLALVEIHRRVGAAEVSALLPAAEVLSAARATDLPGMKVPRADHRIVHLLAHAQIGTPRPQWSTFTLRDLAGFHFGLRSMGEDDREKARIALSHAGHAAVWQGFRNLAAAIFDDAPLPRGDAWAHRALALFADPGRQRRHENLKWGRYYLGAILTDPAARRRYLGKLASPGQVLAALNFHRRRNRLLK